MNIQELSQKVKELKDRLNTRELYTALLIVVVGFGSFGLGRLSKLQEGKMPIRIEQGSAAVVSIPPLLSKEGTGGVVKSPLAKGVSESARTGVISSPAPNLPAQAGGQLVASKGGTKYHFPWCSGAQRISEANKIWFSSAEEARKAGYTPASNCKGLK
ncbi:MAG: hypothetical protein Q7R64_02095 [bacterium]|nr:hypothetical protein [bacterium]